jgi:thiol-disulfide isomerase/thioredoxin/thioredoxin reductase
MEIEPPPWTSETIGDASKRDIVVYLRASMASVPNFLEKHRLKGQKKAVVNGSRMPALKTAYAEFLAHRPGGPDSLAGLEMAQGEEVRFGEGVVVVEFWATWCPPCKAAIPHLNELSLKYKDGVRFIGITSEGADVKSRREVERFIKQMDDKFTYPVGLDSGGMVSAHYHVQGIPTAFVVDKEGIVAWQGHPADKGMEAAIEASRFRLDQFIPEFSATIDAPVAEPEVERSTATCDTAEPKMLQAQDYAAALGDVSALSHAAVARGKALLAQLEQRLHKQLADNKGARNDLDADALALHAPLDMFMLAQRLQPDNAEAKSEAAKLQGVLGVLARSKHRQHNHPKPLDVVIVGAGASGVGVAIMLTRTFGLDPKRVMLIERGDSVGETFRRWPAEMRFISPSFNQQGWTASFDLNSVSYGTSPAFTLHAEHPTGEQYATYLSALAEAAELRVRTSTEVTAVRPSATGSGGFEIDLASRDLFDGGSSKPQPLQSRYVIWAAGEFQYPRASATMFPGSEHCLHNSSVRSWTELPGDDFVVIGGYESGMDAASNLATCGKRCTVVSSTAFWRVTSQDPSTELAPYTAERVRTACASPTPPRLLAPLRVSAVERLPGGGGGDNEGGYVVRARWGAPVEHKSNKHRTPAPGATEGELKEGAEVSLRTPQPPLLCVGFEGSIVAGVAKGLFEWPQNKDGGGCTEGSPLLTEHDESTKTPGLFLVGPAVRHGELSFCFVYKFRQRFGVVADAIARGLGRDTTQDVETCRKMNMFLDDFECCKAACGESC